MDIAALLGGDSGPEDSSGKLYNKLVKSVQRDSSKMAAVLADMGQGSNPEVKLNNEQVQLVALGYLTGCLHAYDRVMLDNFGGDAAIALQAMAFKGRLDVIKIYYDIIESVVAHYLDTETIQDLQDLDRSGAIAIARYVKKREEIIGKVVTEAKNKRDASGKTEKGAVVN